MSLKSKTLIASLTTAPRQLYWVIGRIIYLLIASACRISSRNPKNHYLIQKDLLTRAHSIIARRRIMIKKVKTNVIPRYKWYVIYDRYMYNMIYYNMFIYKMRLTKMFSIGVIKSAILNFFQPLLNLSENWSLVTYITNLGRIHGKLFKLSCPQGQIIDVKCEKSQ